MRLVFLSVAVAVFISFASHASEAADENVEERAVETQANLVSDCRRQASKYVRQNIHKIDNAWRTHEEYHQYLKCMRKRRAALYKQRIQQDQYQQ